MKFLPKVGILAAFSAAIALSCWSIAGAQQEGDHSSSNLTATPFIAAERPDVKHFESSVVSTRQGNSFFVSSTAARAPIGTYPGILIESDDRNHSARDLRSLSFSYKSKTPFETIIEYSAPGRLFQRSIKSLPANSPRGEFTRVFLTNEQLGIPERNTINKIVIAPADAKKKGHLLIDDMKINDDPVKKVLDTLFFAVDSTTIIGPKGAIAAASCTPGTTSVVITNGYSDPVVIFLTLLPIAGCSAEQDVKQIFPTMSYFQGQTFIGTVTLQGNGNPGSTLTSSYAAPYSGNISAGSLNLLCPTNLFMTGTNLAEFTVNNSCQGPAAQETLDISCVNGVNAKWRWNASSDGQSEFITVVDTRPTPPKIVTVKQFQNSPGLYDNTSIAGVFPFGCTNCTNNDGVSCCPPPVTAGTNPMSANPPNCVPVGAGNPVPPSTSYSTTPAAYGSCNPTYFLGCNVSRNASCNGGTLTCTYLGPATTDLKKLNKPK